jgi:hypothetical protein
MIRISTSTYTIQYSYQLRRVKFTGTNVYFIIQKMSHIERQIFPTKKSFPNKLITSTLRKGQSMRSK